MSETPKKKPLYGKGSGPGGRPGNSNALRHGMRGSKLPADCEYVEKRVNALRRHIEALVLAIKGEISFTDAAAINSIHRWETVRCLAAHWLRREADKLSASDRLRYATEMAKAGDNRDRNIKLLGLDRDAADDLLNSLYARPRLLPPPKGEANEQPA